MNSYILQQTYFQLTAKFLRKIGILNLQCDTVDMSIAKKSLINEAELNGLWNHYWGYPVHHLF